MNTIEGRPDDIQELRTYLDEIGLSGVEHTQADVLSHLVGVCSLLERWGLPGHVCRAGLFHSIYGTEGFPRPSLPLAERGRMRNRIGRVAEELVYVYCAMTYDSLQASVDDGTTELVDRFHQECIELREETYQELLWIKLADAIEQASEETWQSRFFASVAQRLGPSAQERWLEARRGDVQSGAGRR